MCYSTYVSYCFVLFIIILYYYYFLRFNSFSRNATNGIPLKVYIFEFNNLACRTL